MTNRRVSPLYTYLLLEVCGDGCGMDNTTLYKIFEPLFTTGEYGRSAGIGLPTAYGIVKQNNFIQKPSETLNPDTVPWISLCV